MTAQSIFGWKRAATAFAALLAVLTVLAAAILISPPPRVRSIQFAAVHSRVS